MADPIPGGAIISGIGGRIYVDSLPSDISDLTSADSYFDISQYQLQIIYLNAECPHSGTFGAIARRRVGYDFTFQATLPLDQGNFPGELLEDDQSVAIRFNLADTSIEPNAVYMGMQQRYYIAPSVLLTRVVTILDATGRDVIRQEIVGVGNSKIFLLPDHENEFNTYLAAVKDQDSETF